MIVAHLIDQALALDALAVWSPLDMLDSERIQIRLAEFGIYWEPSC